MKRKRSFIFASLAVLVGFCVAAWLLWSSSMNRSYSSVGPGYVERTTDAYFRMFKRYPRDPMEPEYQRLFPNTQEIVLGKDPGRADTYFVASARSARAKKTYFRYEYRGEREPPVVQWVPSPAGSGEGR